MYFGADCIHTVDNCCVYVHCDAHRKFLAETGSCSIVVLCPALPVQIRLVPLMCFTLCQNTVCWWFQFHIVDGFR